MEVTITSIGKGPITVATIFRPRTLAAARDLIRKMKVAVREATYPTYEWEEETKEQ